MARNRRIEILYDAPDVPSVMQHQFSETVRITWNPDDRRFHVEQLSQEGDWETVRTRAGTSKGFQNAVQVARLHCGV